jgi:hypothetical protein
MPNISRFSSPCCKSGDAAGPSTFHLMHNFVDRLTPDDIEDAAAFFASVNPAALRF